MCLFWVGFHSSSQGFLGLFSWIIFWHLTLAEPLAKPRKVSQEIKPMCMVFNIQATSRKDVKIESLSVPLISWQCDWGCTSHPQEWKVSQVGETWCSLQNWDGFFWAPSLSNHSLLFLEDDCPHDLQVWQWLLLFWCGNNREFAY